MRVFLDAFFFIWKPFIGFLMLSWFSKTGSSLLLEKKGFSALKDLTNLFPPACLSNWFSILEELEKLQLPQDMFGLGVRLAEKPLMTNSLLQLKLDPRLSQELFPSELSGTASKLAKKLSSILNLSISALSSCMCWSTSGWSLVLKSSTKIVGRLEVLLISWTKEAPWVNCEKLKVKVCC